MYDPSRTTTESSAAAAAAADNSKSSSSRKKTTDLLVYNIDECANLCKSDSSCKYFKYKLVSAVQSSNNFSNICELSEQSFTSKKNYFFQEVCEIGKGYVQE